MWEIHSKYKPVKQKNFMAAKQISTEKISLLTLCTLRPIFRLHNVLVIQIAPAKGSRKLKHVKDSRFKINLLNPKNNAITFKLSK